MQRDLSRALKQAPPLCLHHRLLTIWGGKGNVFRGHPAHTGLLSIRLMFQGGLQKAGVTHADIEMPQLIFATGLNEHGGLGQTVPGRCSGHVTSETAE